MTLSSGASPRSSSNERHRFGFDNKEWQVHKFGGTSVANAECFLKAAAIVEEQLGISANCPAGSSCTDSQRHLAVVVSAMGGKPKVTDLLLSAVTAAADRNEEAVASVMELIAKKHSDCLDALPLHSANKKDDETVRSLKVAIASDLNDIRDILKTVSLMKWQATRISELVSGFGELWSAQILCALLAARADARSTPNPDTDATEANSNFSVGMESRAERGRVDRHCFVYVDARRVITIDEEAIKDGAVCWEICEEKLRELYNLERAKLSDGDMLHFVVTGFVASNTHGVATTLQRDGSDYTAAIMGRLLQSTNITIWTDVDGVLSADPRRVPEAHVLPEVSFNEAMELAYFGAKVIHPKTMQPAIMSHPQIPIYIRNTFRSAFIGTRIYTTSTTNTDPDRCVCGFSSIENMALINVEGSGMVGVKGVARRLFGTLEGAGVNVVLISQASSEHSITFATTAKQAHDAKAAIAEEFHKELKQNHISEVQVQEPCSIIAAVGDGMSSTTGVAGRFFSALGDAKINVLAISQGSSERNISAVVWESESTRAMRACHAAFRLSHTAVRVGVVGMNEIGNSLVRLLESQRHKMRKAFEIDLQVTAILSESSSPDVVTLKQQGAVNADSITISSFDKATGGSLLLGAAATSITFDEPFHAEAAQLSTGGLSALADHVISTDCAHSVIFDCTADAEIGKKHADWLKAGINVVTANNNALSGPVEIRNAIKDAENGKGIMSAKYLREVTVGGGLPIISTLRDLLNSGDKIRRMDGILSISMSYILHRIAPPSDMLACSEFDETVSKGVYRGELSMSPKATMGKSCAFSVAVKEAIALGLMEVDPVKDLSNEYTARCLMVLAKELGLDNDYDVKRIQSLSESLLDENVEHYSDDVAANLDVKIKQRVAAAAAKGCVPRHISSVDVKTGIIEIRIVDVPNNHVFAITPSSCECVRFFTQRHKRYPLIVQGPSAGADSTASALLAELLNLMRNKVGPRTGALSRTASSAYLA